MFLATDNGIYKNKVKMKKKAFLFIGMIILTMSCKGQTNKTLSRYESTVKVSKSLYQGDSMQVHDILKKMLYQHLHPFRPQKQFDSETKIFVDSILYSPDRLRMVVFVITRNSTGKLLKKENKAPFFYNANYLFCSRDNEKSHIRVYDYVGFNLVNYYKYNEVKERLKEFCFSGLGGKQNKYNIDDKRFWKSNDFEWVLKNSQATQVR